MNPDNYASIEASKRLVEAGIVLETEAGWYKIFRPGCHSFGMVLSMRSGNEKFYGDNYPAPSMAEVWRELPKSIVYGGLVLEKVLCQRDDSDDNFAEGSKDWAGGKWHYAGETVRGAGGVGGSLLTYGALRSLYPLEWLGVSA